MDKVPPGIVLGIDYGPDYDTVAVCAIDPDTGAVALVDIRRIGHDEEPEVEVTEVTNALGEMYARTETCTCDRFRPHGPHPKGLPGCYYEENR